MRTGFRRRSTHMVRSARSRLRTDACALSNQKPNNNWRDSPTRSYRFDTASDEQQASFLEADIASAVGCRLRKFPDDHQFGQRRHATNAPKFPAGADSFDKRRRKLKGEAFIAARVMVVRALVFGARTTDENRSSH